MSRLRIAAGRVIDPASGFDGPADVLVQDGRVVGRSISAWAASCAWRL